MGAVEEAATHDSELVPVVEDMSVFIAAGRVESAAISTAEALDAERLGFRRAWLCERFEVKEAGALLGAAVGVTSRLEVATGPLIPSARPPLVTGSLGATLHSLSSGRFIMGVARGVNSAYFDGWGFRQMDFPSLIDYCGILRRLWNGEAVAYDGPAGSWSNLQLKDLPEGPPPKIVFCHNGGPKASRVAANPVFDGFMLPFLNLEAAHNSLSWSREECERIGRDPATLSMYQTVASAPDLDEFQTDAFLRVRVLMGVLLTPNYPQLNGWDPKVMDIIRSDPFLGTLRTDVVDQTFNSPAGRAQLVETARRLIPDSYFRDVTVIGSTSECVKKLQAFKDLGVDELVLYTMPPSQYAGLLGAWRDHRGGSKGEK
jgi:probable F420-dependent oxidoreductase